MASSSETKTIAPYSVTNKDGINKKELVPYMPPLDHFKALSTKRGSNNALTQCAKFSQLQFKVNKALSTDPKAWTASELNAYGLERLFRELCMYFEDATYGDNSKEYEVGTKLQYIGTIKQYFFDKYKHKLNKYDGNDTTQWYNDLFSFFVARLRSTKMTRGQTVSKRTTPIYSIIVQGE